MKLLQFHKQVTPRQMRATHGNYKLRRRCSSQLARAKSKLRRRCSSQLARAKSKLRRRCSSQLARAKSKLRRRCSSQLARAKSKLPRRCSSHLARAKSKLRLLSMRLNYFEPRRSNVRHSKVTCDESVVGILHAVRHVPRES